METENGILGILDMPHADHAEREDAHHLVSVCIATYNGSRFVRQQIVSILEQTVQIDEIVIVDDASSDGTVDVIRSFRDPRIKLLRNETNLGVVRSFEKAITHATGDLIFLCDQDDIWRSDKVEVFKRFFAVHHEVTIVISDASVIDQDGKEIRRSWFGLSGFNPGLVRNIVRNRYMGCMMALRRSELAYCLPIPPHIPMHDMWIGMLNQVYGQVGYIAEPLFSYRRHGNNVTTGKHAPLTQMLLWRFRFVWELARRFARKTISPRG